MNSPPRTAEATRVTWREAAAARGKLTGGYLLTPEERLRLTQVVLARGQHTTRLFNRVNQLFVYFVGLSCVLVIAVCAIGLPSALRAAKGAGVRGVFTAQSVSCAQVSAAARACFWNGTFTSADGQARADVTYDDRLPATTHPGSVVAALYPGGSNEVFAVHGSTVWLWYVLTMTLASVGLLASLWRGSVWYLRRRTGAVR